MLQPLDSPFLTAKLDAHPRIIQLRFHLQGRVVGVIIHTQALMPITAI